MKILIVDDEIITLKMLKNIIPFERLELEPVGFVQDGNSAYKIFTELQPDIVISDIRMNAMDGLELAKKIHDTHSQTKILLMSAYADFSYVKQAIQLGCSDYVLKPIDEDELIKSLEKMISEIKGNNNTKKIIDKSEKYIRNLELYKYMRDNKGFNNVIRYKNDYNINFDKYYLILVDENISSINEYMNKGNLEIIQQSYVENILEDIVVKKYFKNMLVIDFESNKWLVIIDCADINEIAGICKEIILSFHQNFKFSIITCFSKQAKNISELPTLYNQVKNLREYDFYIGDTEILGYDYNCVEQEIDRIHKIGLMKEAQQAVKNFDTEYAIKVLNELFEISAVFQPDALNEIYDFCIKLIYCIQDCLENSDEISKYNFTYSTLKQYGSLKELKAFMMHTISLINNNKSEKKYSQIIEEGINIIENNYGENLSLNDICNKIAVSKNYFCYLFKREVGISPWTYLTQIRLKYAKRLLETTDLKTYEIAFKVGYDNPSYFSKIFKKTEDMTPNEYREKKNNIVT